MRKFLVSTAAAVGLMVGFGGTIPAQAQQQWVAVAAYGSSYFVGRGWSEEGARNVALNSCANYAGRTCSRHLSASVPQATWFLAVVHCPNGMAAGGSRISLDNAMQMAAQRRGYQSWACGLVDWGN